MTRFVDYYALLEIARSAEVAEIQQAVRDKRRVWRKRAELPSVDARTKAETMIQQLADAERELLDPTARANYDKQLATHDSTPSPQPSKDSTPNQDPTRPRDTSRDWLEIAREYLDARQNGQAHYAAKEATAAHPESPEAWFLRGASAMFLGDDSDAQFGLSEAVRLDPADDLYHSLLGDFYASAGRWSDALAAYGRASQLQPASVDYEIDVAVALGRTGRYDLALPTLERIVAEHPAVDRYRAPLADVLLLRVDDNMSSYEDGSQAILSKSQLKLARQTIARVRALQVDDQDVRQSLAELERHTAEQSRRQFMGFGRLPLYLVVFAVVLLYTVNNVARVFTVVSIGPAEAEAVHGVGFEEWLSHLVTSALWSVAGIVSAVGIGVLYAFRHSVPQWKLQRMLASFTVRSSGLQSLRDLR